MSSMIHDNEFEGLATRKSFNRNLRHFKSANLLISGVENGSNLADLVSQLLVDGELQVSQILPLINSLLVEKFQYRYVSVNLKESLVGLEKLLLEFQDWHAVDLVFIYHDFESGIRILNPKNPVHWKNISELKKNELLVAYLGFGNQLQKIAEKKVHQIVELSAARIVAVLSRGSKLTKVPISLADGDFVFKLKPISQTVKNTSKTSTKNDSARSGIKKTMKSPVTTTPPVGIVSEPARQLVTASGKVIVSPKIPIQVTNELFHNGNVEAWKKIISSYTSKFPHCRVNVYYDGELILDINSLFKWGKVKHGTSILVSVSTQESKLMDLAKLRKYLLEGASPRFEYFLKGAPGKTLELF